MRMYDILGRMRTSFSYAVTTSALRFSQVARGEACEVSRCANCLRHVAQHNLCMVDMISYIVHCVWYMSHYKNKADIRLV